MSQDVNIIGIDGVTPPEWATETTLEAMLEKIDDLVKITEGQRRDLKSGIAGKSGSTGGSSDKEQQKATNLLGKLSKSLKDTGMGAAESAAGFDKLPGPLAKFGKELKNTSGATKIAALGIGMIGNQIGKAIAGVKESVSTLRDLSDSGIRLEGGILEVQRGLAETGMTLADFGQTAAQYAQIINQKGWSSISNLASVVNKSAGGFQKWGMTTAEGIDITAEYLDQQRRVGVFQAMDQTKQSNLIATTMDRLTAYSKVLNVSRKDMLDARKEMKTSRDVQAQLALKDEASRARANIGLDSMSDAASSLGEPFAFIHEALTDFAGTDIDVLSKSFQDLAAGGGADAAHALIELANGAMEGKTVTQSMLQDFVRKYGGNDEFMQNLLDAGGPAKEFATNMLIARKTVEEAQIQEARLRDRGGKAYQESVDGNVQALTGFEDMLQKVQASFEYKRIEGFLGLLGGTGTDAVRLATEGLRFLHQKIMGFDAGMAMTKFREFVLENPALAAAGLVAAFAALNIAVLASVGKFGMAGAAIGRLGKGAGIAGAAFAGWQIGSAIYNATANTDTMRGVGNALGAGLDSTLAFFGNDAAQSRRDIVNGTGMPDVHSEAAVAERKARRDAARAKAQADQSPTTTSSTAATAPAEPTMSATDIAKLDQAAQTNYYLSELLKVNKKTGRALTGDSMN